MSEDHADARCDATGSLLMRISNVAVIAGVGATDFSKNSGRSELRLAAEAVTAALRDAGISPAEVDGFCTFVMDNNAENELQRAVGAGPLTFFSRIHYGGGGGCGAVQQAVLAVAAGIANVVVCYRAMNERSEYRFGGPTAGAPTSEGVVAAYHALHGLQTAGAKMAISMRRYMHETGARPEDFANVSLAARRHAAVNPAAFFYKKPITLDDYMNSKMIADPLRLLDCCQESDGGVAIVVTRRDHPAVSQRQAVSILAAAQGMAPGTFSLMNYYRDDISPRDEVALMARQLYEQSGLSARDMQVGIIYDHFGPAVLPSLEACGFCEPGEAKDFVKHRNVEIGGTLPINTHGGQLGEAYIHGMNGIVEAVRQVRGESVNQVANVHNVLVTSGSGVPTSGLILGKL
jgi:acetyl-CoA acetyltransferase